MVSYIDMKSSRPSAAVRVGRVLLAFLVCLAGLHVVAVLSGRNMPSPALAETARLFDLDNELNVSAMYTAFLLAGCALLALILSTRKQTRLHKATWFFLATGFLYLAFDESLSIHEKFAEPVRRLLNIGNQSVWYHAWTVPALAVAVVGFGVFVYAKRQHIVSRQQTSIFLLLFTLIAVTIGLEAGGTLLYDNQLVYKLGPVMAEELFEVGMISLILYRLVGYDWTRQKTNF